MKLPAVCYKTKEPVLIAIHYDMNGVRHDKTCDHFLQYLVPGKIEEAQRDCDCLNKEKPSVDRCGNKIDWEKVDHFFVNVQEDLY